MTLQQLLVLGRAVDDAQYFNDDFGRHSYTELQVAVNQTLKNNEVKTSYYTVIISNKTAELAGEIKKGDLVMIDGLPEAENNKIIVYATKWKIIK